MTSKVSERTPGPWIITDGATNEINVSSKNGQFICSPSGNTVGQVIDNAKLIAAAPDLLRLLNRSMLWVYACRVKNEKRLQMLADYEALYNEIEPSTSDDDE